MNKKSFEDELMVGMHKELVKQALGDAPNLSKAAECLHAALEIFEEQGLEKQANQVIKILFNIAKKGPSQKIAAPKLHSLQQLMEAGVSQRDLREFARGNPIATAKLNLVLRRLGVPDHEIAKFLGHGNLMSEEEARKTINPNEPGSILEFESLSPETSPEEKGEPLEFKSIAQHKINDPATKGLTPEKQVKNLKQYGIPLNVNHAEDSVLVPQRKDKLSIDDMEADFVGLLDAPSFDMDASDDELMGMEIKEDSLEVYDNEDIQSDFEDERN